MKKAWIIICHLNVWTVSTTKNVSNVPVSTTLQLVKVCVINQFASAPNFIYNKVFYADNNAAKNKSIYNKEEFEMKKFEMPEVIILNTQERSSVKTWYDDDAPCENNAIAETYCNH